MWWTRLGLLTLSLVLTACGGGGGGGGGFETTSNSAVAVSKLENSIKNPRSTPNGESDLWDPNGVGCLWDKNDPNTFPDPLAP